MPLFDLFLLVCSAAVVLVWTALSVHLIAIHRRRTAARSTIAAAMAAFENGNAVDLPLRERVDRIRPILEQASRELVMFAAADRDTPRSVADALRAYLVERWSVEALERDAAAHRSGREKWRRMTALQILFTLRHPRRMQLAADAVDDRDSDVAFAALALLSDSEEPSAIDILLRALRSRTHPASRVAVHLDRSPQHLADRLQPLLADDDPVVRRWAATLLSRYSDAPGLEQDLERLVTDEDPGVRKAAIEALGYIGDAGAAGAAVRLLDDPVPFVRAAAIRAIGRLERDDLATAVTGRLGDTDWWVRFAAKECLEAMGPDIWPVLVRRLDDPDRFVRNGAAEVFQNLGVLDSFIVLEAASDAPAPRNIELLRRITAAGGVRLTDSLFERAGPSLAPRLRHLLSTLGLEHVGAA